MDFCVGICLVCVSFNGQYLVLGDCMGIFRVYEFQFLSEMLKVEVYDFEILCLEYFKLDIGLKLLVLVSWDWLIYVLDVGWEYSLQQILDEYLFFIIVVKFVVSDG